MANKTSAKRKTQQRQAIIRIIVLAAILVCINMLAARFHAGLDLTKEKRFTLTEPTKRFLRDMKDIAVVEVYLKADDLPAGFQRLKNVVEERLQSFKDIAGNNIIYRFTDPFEGKAENEKQPIYEELAGKEIFPVNIQMSADQGYSEKLIFPYALVRYNGKELAVRLLENNVSMGGLENIGYSEALLEYKLIDAINKLSMPDKPTIGYIVGNGEALGIKTVDLLTTLQKNYRVDTIDLVGSTYISSIYDAIIICKPTIPFDDQEKFKIDQYVMKGGRVLWAVDAVQASMDSLRDQQFMAIDHGLNLDDQFFKYGVRFNTNVIEDMSCNQIPITIGKVGQSNQISLRPWIYFPIFIPTADHPIVKNMDAVMSEFAGSIDTIQNPEINKTILLTSSKYSRISETPARISLSMLNYPVDPQMFSKGYQPVAVLAEGKFRSVFQNRLHPIFLKTLRDSLKQPFKAEVDSVSSMIFIADGDILLNDFSSTKGVMPMGYWQYTNERFSNKAFVLNCIEYLIDRSGILEARSKEVKLRLLDGARVKKEKTKWQVLNIGIPIALILIFASGYLFFRKRRYEIKHQE